MVKPNTYHSTCIASKCLLHCSSPQLVAQRAWLDAEVERMLQQKEAVEMLEKVCSHMYPGAYHCLVYSNSIIFSQFM